MQHGATWSERADKEGDVKDGIVTEVGQKHDQGKPGGFIPIMVEPRVALSAMFTILDAVEHAKREHPHFADTDAAALAVLVEEVGEVAKAVQELDADGMRREIAQVAAVCVRWLEGGRV